MKLVRHIPNTITSMNLLCGVIGVIFTLEGRSDIGFILMLGAAIFDFFDGFVARLLNAHSEIGKELDSLADMISFGVLPSLMMYKLYSSVTNIPVLGYFPIILAVFSALRLAKFNIDERQSNGFLGLPTPASAMICGSLAYFTTTHQNSLLFSLISNNYTIPIIVIILSYLVVSEIPMFAMKFGKDHKADTITNIKRTGFISIFVIICATILLTGYNWSLIFLYTFLVYIIMNIVFGIVKKSN